MCYGQNMVQNRKHNLGRIRLIRKLLREFCKVPTSRQLWCRGLLLVYGLQMYPKIILVKMIGASLGLRCFSVSSFSVTCIPLSRQVAKKLMPFFGITMLMKHCCCLWPMSTRAASRIYFTFQQAILAIKTITLADTIPVFSSKKCSSLRHFSFSGTFAGLPCRPCLPNPSETCQAVFSYISRLGGADSFYLPFNLLSAPVPFNVVLLQELPIVQRHQVWQRIVTRRYKQKARDRRNSSPAIN